LAREGVDVKLQPRPITIYAFELTRFELPEIDFKVVCSTGTYIRSLANDIGETLGCGGYLSLLRRTRIGSFLVEDAIPLDIAEERAKSFFYDRERK
jgi:tRNA pseudouridine55 synthase